MRKILLATTMLVGISSAADAQRSVVVMRRVIDNMTTQEFVVTPTPVPTPTPGATPTPSPTPTQGSGPTPTPTPAPGGSGTPTPTPTPSPTGTPTTPGSGGTGTTPQNVSWYSTGWVVAKSCGATTESTVYSCRDGGGAVVADSYCVAAVGAKPAETRNVNNYDTCIYDWNMGAYGAWSSTCSASATRTRTVDCQRQDGTVASSPALCTKTKPPTTETAAVTTSCRYQWKKIWSIQAVPDGTGLYGPWTGKSRYSHTCWDTSTNKASTYTSDCNTAILGPNPGTGPYVTYAVTPSLDVNLWNEDPVKFYQLTNDFYAGPRGTIIDRKVFTLTGTPLTGAVAVQKKNAYDFCVTRIAGFFNAKPNFSPTLNKSVDEGETDFPRYCEISKMYRSKTTGQYQYEVVISASKLNTITTNSLSSNSDMVVVPDITGYPAGSGYNYYNYDYSRTIQNGTNTSTSAHLNAHIKINSTPEESGCTPGLTFNTVYFQKCASN